MISGVHLSLLFVWVPVMIISDHYRSSNPSLDTWDLHIQYHHCTQSNLKQYKLHRYCLSLVLMVTDQSRCSFSGDKECKEILFGRIFGGFWWIAALQIRWHLMALFHLMFHKSCPLMQWTAIANDGCPLLVRCNQTSLWHIRNTTRSFEEIQLTIFEKYSKTRSELHQG